MTRDGKVFWRHSIGIILDGEQWTLLPSGAGTKRSMWCCAAKRGRMCLGILCWGRSRLSSVIKQHPEIVAVIIDWTLYLALSEEFLRIPRHDCVGGARSDTARFSPGCY